MLRCVSEYQLAILKPKVMGSAWTAVRAADHGRVFELPGAALRELRRGAAGLVRSPAEACRISRACAVSTTSLEVRP